MKKHRRFNPPHNRLISIWQREPRNWKANLKLTWEDILKVCFSTKNRYINNIQIQQKHLNIHPCECSTYHLSPWCLKANQRNIEGPGGGNFVWVLEAASGLRAVLQLQGRHRCSCRRLQCLHLREQDTAFNFEGSVGDSFDNVQRFSDRFPFDFCH